MAVSNSEAAKVMNKNRSRGGSNTSMFGFQRNKTNEGSNNSVFPSRPSVGPKRPVNISQTVDMSKESPYSNSEVNGTTIMPKPKRTEAKIVKNRKGSA